MLTFSEFILKESGAGLSRVLEHLYTTECCIITAFRGSFSLRQNRQRNNDLENDLINFIHLDKPRGYIKVKGGYKEQKVDENGNKVFDEDGIPEFVDIEGEESFFIPRAATILDRLLELGEDFDQDSILYTEPLRENSLNAYFIGTSNVDNAWPAYHQRELIGNQVRVQDEKQPYFTIVKDKRFSLVKIEEDLTDIEVPTDESFQIAKRTFNYLKNPVTTSDRYARKVFVEKFFKGRY